MSNWKPTDVRAGIVAYVNDAGEFEFHKKMCTLAEYNSWCDEMIVPDGRTYVWGWGSPTGRAMAEFLVGVGLRLRPGEFVKSVTVHATLAKGQTAAEAIGKLRVEMLALAQDLAKVRHAPLPIADQVAAAEKYVAQRAAYSGPRIGVQRDQLQLSWQDDVIGSKQDMLAVLCWLAPTSVVTALKREIETQPSPSNAMPAADRIAKVQELEAQLLDLERREASLLDKADNVLPRPDMSPMAFLGVEIAAQIGASPQQQVA
jgi:hypothetical protein